MNLTAIVVLQIVPQFQDSPSTASPGSAADPEGLGGDLSVKIRYVQPYHGYYLGELGPVAGNERVSSRKISDARLHTTETETEDPP